MKVYDYQVWTDGSCLGNPGVGGWAYVCLGQEGARHESSGSSPLTTNNRMELMAAIQAVERIEVGAAVCLYTDSKYVQLGMTQWLSGWLKRGWRSSSGGLVLNIDLWQALQAAAQHREMTWVWVKGHAQDPMNEYVDRLARQAASHALENAKG